ncbi:MAG: alpha-glucuronidase family glycosyl hydrolase [Chitinophagaceae bacterium]
MRLNQTILLRLAFVFLTGCTLFSARAENGYDLWLRYKPLSGAYLSACRQQVTALSVQGNSPVLQAAREELTMGLSGLLNTAVPLLRAVQHGTILIGTPSSSPAIAALKPDNILQQTGAEGYFITSQAINGKKCIVITANTDQGLLYGVFHFLRLVQTRQPLTGLHIVSAPRTQLRLLNHWDNLDRHVERGYAGISLWNWHTLPGYTDPRYKDYARANASIGINGTVLTNVNANATVLTRPYLEKVAALAAVFRPYGIKVYLTARFSAPVEIGKLRTADPLNDTVQRWWNEKAKEIYSLIPDFGGFLVKANSEGQPGPQNYGRTHADGANMLAKAVAPFRGIVMWRAFVYSNEVPDDRHKQAYNEFVPLDGTFDRNVLVQVKNGAIDFQPREPFHPLFGAMPRTPLMMEFQLTQEYLGFATHLVYLAPLFKECLDSDTYAKGKGTTVGKVIDGSAHSYAITGMAGVANIGNDLNWCGHPFAQSNWYALGRLAWDHELTAAQIAEEWLRMTFTNDAAFVEATKKIMLESREVTVNYMTPIGLHHIMGAGHHYGPGPWVSRMPRADWTSVYYHRADSAGIGFDRTSNGSNAIGQYTPAAAAKWKDPSTCDDKYLLWFHHLPWQYTMKSGKTLWDELCSRYYSGVDSVRRMQQVWNTLKDKIDPQRFSQVKMLLQIQEEEAVWWRNACLLYFQTFSKMPLPAGYEKPDHTLNYYMQLTFPFAPGN